jgi:hypothetical protein
MAKKLEFRAPSDLVEGREEAMAAAAAMTSTALVGTWSNCDKATRGLVRIAIAASGAGITVHAFGACTPTPCDWGPVPGMAYAENVSSSAAVAFSAHYKFGFKETIVVGHLDVGSLPRRCARLTTTQAKTPTTRPSSILARSTPSPLKRGEAIGRVSRRTRPPQGGRHQVHEGFESRRASYLTAGRESETRRRGCGRRIDGRPIRP